MTLSANMSETPLPHLPAGSTTTLEWSANDHLNSVTRGNVTLSYGYDAFGQLAQLSRKVGSGSVALERQFRWDQVTASSAGNAIASLATGQSPIRVKANPRLLNDRRLQARHD